jgi:hypothetical protein
MPRGPWGATWVCALVLAATTIGGVEWFWRAHGYQPALLDDKDLWAAQRVNVTSDAIVMIGSSRNQAAIATDVIRRELPGREVVQLSVPGGSPQATLRDLAEDEGFRGVVLCDLLSPCLLREKSEAQTPYVRHARRSFNVARRIERSLKTAVQTRLVVNSAQLRPGFVAHAIIARVWPKHEFFNLQPDRSRHMDFRRVEDRSSFIRTTAEVLRNAYEGTVPPDARGWQADVDLVDRLVERIQARGGKVVYLRHPSNGEVRDLEDKLFPKTKYWDTMAARTKASAVIHYGDVPALAGYTCPDGSHLDYRDAVPYTERLVDELRARGIFPTR